MDPTPEGKIRNGILAMHRMKNPEEQAIEKQEFLQEMRQYLKKHHIFWDAATEDDIMITYQYHTYWHSAAIRGQNGPSEQSD